MWTCTSAHLHTCTSAHLHICTSAHLHLCTSEHVHSDIKTSSKPLMLSDAQGGHVAFVFDALWCLGIKEHQREYFDGRGVRLMVVFDAFDVVLLCFWCWCAVPGVSLGRHQKASKSIKPCFDGMALMCVLLLFDVVLMCVWWLRRVLFLMCITGCRRKPVHGIPRGNSVGIPLENRWVSNIPWNSVGF